MLRWGHVLEINYFIEFNCRWPVPMPRWCHLEDRNEDKSDDELGFEPKSGRKRRYGYIRGRKVVLF
jgi:hypothetical protein